MPKNPPEMAALCPHVPAAFGPGRSLFGGPDAGSQQWGAGFEREVTLRNRRLRLRQSGVRHLGAGEGDDNTISPCRKKAEELRGR